MKTSRLPLILLLMVLLACNNSDERYFNGNIVMQDLPAKMDTLHGEQIELDGIFCGSIIAYDTLLIFKSPKYEDYAMYVFSTNSKKHIASLAPIGKGPDECESIDYYNQYIVDNNEYKLFVVLNKNNCRWLNVTASLEQGKTVWEPVLDFPSKLSNYYAQLWMFDKNTFIEGTSHEIISNDMTDYIPPLLNLRKKSDESVLQVFKPYKEKLVNRDPIGSSWSSILLEFFHYLKPDHSKLALGMFCLPQVNIIDLDTWKMTGYRLDMDVDFKRLTKDLTPLHFHYMYGACDDAFIYMPHLGWLFTEMSVVTTTHELHVYNWEGALVKRYYLDHPFYETTIDPVTGKMYATNNEDQLFCYTLK